ncbi:MAG: NTP transferase domain-containing protein [Gemmatimonadetes bacterium]|nr:nucleotidyltransferase family protein [Gemmatimonadota bacterium]NIR79807.1 nucleotidyltransferase family protein [Gemmatimonadota bacterium]NIT88513.1 nucleotidyltransferase family protein [Gemmatimonadota bacterium]NIU32333.1 nucleotidyltransferase family protein [Gemmatimonadota bacterium]NIU36852.1 NTP transferase domain-containing protein [Gemmatimonadota bacterium]
MTVAGIVPAAGRSSRMGTPKPLLDAGGQSFLQAVVGSLARGGCVPVLVVLREESGPVAAMARTAGARTVVNPDPSAGPISSLRAGIRALDEADDELEGVAFCPVDHPLVAHDTVERLLRTFRAGDAPAVVPAHGERRGHPVFFRRSLFPELLEEGLEEGARTVLHRHLEEVEEVTVEDEGVLADIDTLGEYRRRFPDAYRKRFQGR